MKSDYSKAQNQLMRWNIIRNEWDDQKLNEIEADYINPMQNLMIFISRKIDEIYDFILITEEELNNIEEEK